MFLGEIKLKYYNLTGLFVILGGNAEPSEHESRKDNPKQLIARLCQPSVHHLLFWSGQSL